MSAEPVVRYALLPIRLVVVVFMIGIAVLLALPMGFVRLCSKLAEPPVS